jgi:hypothetical protein
MRNSSPGVRSSSHATARSASSSTSAYARFAATTRFIPRQTSSHGINSGERNGSGTIAIPVASAVSRATRVWCGGALSQTSRLFPAGVRAATAAMSAALSAPRFRSRTARTIAPVAMFSAPCTTRRAFLPLITTVACSPRRAHAARKGGNSRSVVSSANQTLPPAASAAPIAAAIAPFFRRTPGRAARAHTSVASTATPTAAPHGARCAR